MLTQSALKGSEIITDQLKRYGIDTVFVIPGVYVLPLIDFLERSGIKVVLVATELGASYMADAYSRIKGFGCCISTAGPGALNMVSGVAGAYMDSIPLLAITLQVPLEAFGRYGIQEGTGLGRTPDVHRIYSFMTKSSRQPKNMDALYCDIHELIEISQEPRQGPVHIDIPANLLTQTFSGDLPMFRTSMRGVERQSEREWESDLDRLIEELSRAKFPVILAGHGVKLSGAQKDFRELNRILKIPVVTTYLSKGIVSENQPESIGSIGYFGSQAANLALFSESDLVIAIGTSFQALATNGWDQSLTNKRLIRVDIDEEEIQRNYKPTFSILADAGEFIKQFLLYLQKKDFKINSKSVYETLARVHEESSRIWVSKECFVGEKGGLDPVSVTKTINGFINDNVVVVIDSGENAYWAGRLLNITNSRNFIVNGGMGAMGYSIPASIGVGMAVNNSPEKRVISIVGDGGFLMSGLELSTAASLGLRNITWVLYDNKILGTQKHWQNENLGQRYVASDTPSVDYVRIAEGVGIQVERVETLDDLKKGLRPSSVSKLLHVLVDPNLAPTKSRTSVS